MKISRASSFFITYRLTTGRSLHVSAAREALADHASLLAAGASDLAIRDERGLVVTVEGVAARADAATHSTPGS